MSLPGAETGRPNGAVGTATVYRPNLACTAAAHVPGTRASWWLMAMVSGSWLHPKTGPSSLALTWLWLCSGSKLKFRPLSQKVKADLCTQIHMPSSQPDTQSASGGPRGQREAQASGVNLGQLWDSGTLQCCCPCIGPQVSVDITRDGAKTRQEIHLMLTNPATLRRQLTNCIS